MSTTFTILSTLTLLIAKNSALTCPVKNSGFEDRCLCVWDVGANSGLEGLRRLNGQYYGVNTPTWAPTAFPTTTSQKTSRKWLMTDVSGNHTQPCSSFPLLFHYEEACAGRWWVGDNTYDGQCTGNCLCNNNNVPDPLSSSCPNCGYECTNSPTPTPAPSSCPETTNGWYADGITVTYGRCPQITDTCTHIQVDAPAPRDACNGIYIHTPGYSPTGLNLDNEINIYVNGDINANNKFVYYDHAVQRWVCAQIYKPCNSNFGNTLIYAGASDDPGTPDPFKSASSITTGSTWDVALWADRNDGASDPSAQTATFTCNPPTPAPVSAPTGQSNNPSKTPSKNPTKTPTDSPSKTPTKTPTDSPSKTPTKTPTGTPIEPTSTPSKTPTSTPTKAPIGNPTKNPTRPGETHNPTTSPSKPPTKTPTISPVTKDPTISPTINPTDNTPLPTKDPLCPTCTHPPTTDNPTPATPTPKPTGLTYPPTESPTPEPTDENGGDESSGDDGIDNQTETDYGYMITINMGVMILIGGYLIV